MHIYRQSSVKNQLEKCVNIASIWVLYKKTSQPVLMFETRFCAKNTFKTFIKSRWSIIWCLLHFDNITATSKTSVHSFINGGIISEQNRHLLALHCHKTGTRPVILLDNLLYIYGDYFTKFSLLDGLLRNLFNSLFLILICFFCYCWGEFRFNWTIYK